MKKNILALLIIYSVNMSAQKKDSLNTNYVRSSIATFMLDNKSIKFDESVQDAFLGKFAPDKYNDHNLNNRIITKNDSGLKDVDYLENYLQENKIGNQLVAKWFNRTAKGGFDNKLVMKRGLYDVKELDKAIAKSTTRGDKAFGDHGLELIDNTFVLVLKSNYTNKEEVAKSIGVGLSILKSVYQQVGDQSSALTADLTKSVVTTLGKGFWVGTKAYLFKLVWNKDTEDQFFNQLWATDKDITPEKKLAFDNSDIFKLEFVGETKTRADVQSTTLSGKSNEQLVERATIKSFDNAVTNLQREYDVFSVKIPIFSSEPIITIKAGLKEGIDSKSKFEILEKVQNEDGTQEYVVVGKLKVDKDYPIWDNRYGADEENPDQKVDVTVLKPLSFKGEIVPGMLLQQTN